MIFIITGSQKFQFNRLLKKVDLLISQGRIKESVFAQTGSSTYRPQNYKYINFMSEKDFDKMLSKSSLVITHGGTGSIMKALREGKKIIGVPRLRTYREHVDDHQIQILNEFKKDNLIEACYNLEYLAESIRYTKRHQYETYKSNRRTVFKSLTDFINKEEVK